MGLSYSFYSCIQLHRTQTSTRRVSLQNRQLSSWKHLLGQLQTPSCSAVTLLVSWGSYTRLVWTYLLTYEHDMCLQQISPVTNLLKLVSYESQFSSESLQLIGRCLEYCIGDLCSVSDCAVRRVHGEEADNDQTPSQRSCAHL